MRHRAVHEKVNFGRRRPLARDRRSRRPRDAVGLVLEALQVLAEGGLVDLEQRCELRDANRRVQLAAAVAERVVARALSL